MKRHTLAALISSLFVLSSAYGYADDTIPDATATLPVLSPEVPVAPPAAPATLNAAELAAVAKGLPQIGTYLIQAQAEQTIQTALQASIRESLKAPTYFHDEIAKVIQAGSEAEEFRNIVNAAVNTPLIRNSILEPAAKYKVQVDGIKAVENYAGYMSSVYRSSADMAAIAALKAASEANQQSFLFNAALHDALTSNQARAHQVYDTLHAYTSTHVVDYNLGKLAQRVLVDQPKIDTLLGNMIQTVFQPVYQENVVGLLASLQQADASIKSSLASSISNVTQNAQQNTAQYSAYLTDNKVADKLNRAALVAAVQESYQGVQSNQRALTQLQQAHQADLTMAHVVAIGAADAVKKANEANIATTADKVKKANEAALRVAQKANADAIHEAKEALSQDIHGNQQNTLAANLMALGALKGVQETTTELQNLQRSSNASSHAFNTALNDSKRELSAAIQANSHSLSRRIDENRKKAAAGIAGVAAMSNIPIPYAEGSFTVGVGVGYYDSQSAGAIGIGKGFENGLAIKASASFATDSNVAIGGGASWNF
ncbi:YadA-like C-terminal region [Edwardsiella tarda]|uniref:YadA C-terminal domain-containing protein n=1 Tax=Edwardsiella tarda ATCC 15947 = NBRC 105688 TaxID=667121 RepID=A0AC61TJQ2_EDWTA|nr:YadA C-terminal domain-containing protein [Edwardsiella tarda]UAL56027.1 YadA C-terminal domain-containing protein [Edwardsiella tarda]UCQ00916.1 YadA C-terminal domain-containing protein [Edwardsiella tarda ATCC 15947 = NBRC 105688]STD28545.1 YadA-like C-terminal region [Edwardsiella tarda]